MSIHKKPEELMLRTVGDTVFAHMIFDDGSAVCLRGPRSGLTSIEQKEGSIIKCEVTFDGFYIFDCPEHKL